MLNMLNMDIKNTFDGLKENNYESDDENNYDSGRLKTSPAHFNISNNNSKSKKNFNRSTFNNYDKNNGLPKINNVKSKDDVHIDEHINITNNMSTIQFGNPTAQNKNKNDNRPHIVKVFRKNK